jgi:hypothetical protein
MINFPTISSVHINMMPIVMGDSNTIPGEVKSYIPIINQCNFIKGDIVYLSISEDYLGVGDFSRRPGIHTDATNRYGWGGGNWGGSEGVYMASNDGACRVWEESVDGDSVDSYGSLKATPKGSSYVLEPNKLYHIGEYTPHESLPSTNKHIRQFFRLVGPKIGVWWKKHSTPSPFGIKPQAVILSHSKF